MAAAFKALNQAVIADSAIIRACSVYVQASGSAFVRAAQVPPNAVGGNSAVDITPNAVDPNGLKFAPAQGFSESIPIPNPLPQSSFPGNTPAICAQAAATAIEAAIAAAIVAGAVAGEVPGPRVRVLFGRDTTSTKPNIQFLLTIRFFVFLATDAGPLGHFA